MLKTYHEFKLGFRDLEEYMVIHTFRGIVHGFTWGNSCKMENQVHMEEVDDGITIINVFDILLIPIT